MSRFPDHVPRVYDVSGESYGRSGIYDAMRYAQEAFRLAEKNARRALRAREAHRKEQFERTRDYYRKLERNYWSAIYRTLEAADERRRGEYKKRYDTLTRVRSGETAS